MAYDDFRTRQVLADLDRVAGAALSLDVSGTAFATGVAGDRHWAAIATLLRQAIAGSTRDPFLEDLWAERQNELRSALAPTRAALMNGFDHLCDFGLLSDNCKPTADDLTTVPASRLKPALIDLGRRMTSAEREHVARADYGCDVSRHRAALDTLLADPDLAYPPGEFWYPAEVVELVSHVPGEPGHVPCLAIVLLETLDTGDRHGNAEFRLESQFAKLELLPEPARSAFFAAFRFHYETDRTWSPSVPATFSLPWTEDD